MAPSLFAVSLLLASLRCGGVAAIRNGRSLLQTKAARSRHSYDTLGSTGAVARAQFAGNCTLYPGKRVVMVTVSGEFVDMFKNWFHFAKPFLKSTEQLRVFAEDHAAVAPLQEMMKQSPQFDVVAPDGVSLLEMPYPYGSKGYKKLVNKRPDHLLSVLEAGCSVLYADVDTAWTKDPFHDIAEATPGDLYITRDTDDVSSFYYCTCFMYMHPTPPVMFWTREWARRMETTGATNQGVYSSMLQDGSLQDAQAKLNQVILPIEKFPPGMWADHAPDATVYHANWIIGHDAKIGFLKRHGVWKM